MKKVDTLSNYFDLIGVKEEYSYLSIRCEVCNNKNFATILTHTDCGSNTLVPLPVSACKTCGFLMQNPRISGDFYSRYYKEFYPKMRAISQSNDPSDPNNVDGKKQMNEDGSANEHGFQVAMNRGHNLYQFLIKRNLIDSKFTGKLLDVGCGCGGFLQYFNDRGWNVKGNDPDELCAKTAIDRGLPVDLIPGEEMKEPIDEYDLVIIIGSLEHCQDPNEVLKRCWNSMKDGAVIVIEGRYLPVSESFRWLNANHQRFFVHQSSQNILIKHGFEIIDSTLDPVCGKNTGRNGGGFAFGKKSSRMERYDMEDKDSRDRFLNKIESLGLVQNIDDIINDIKEHDKKFDINIKYMNR